MPARPTAPVRARTRTKTVRNGAGASRNVTVAESPTGLGVFARRPLADGESILVFRGKPIDFEATVRKGERERAALPIGPDLYLDLDPPGRFVNHSCDPNAGIRDGVRLIALRDLLPGDEIRFDYSTAMDEGHWTLDCRCGSPNCRGRIRDFRWLPTDRKLELIRRGVVAPFIVTREIDSGRLPATAIDAGHAPPTREDSA